MNRTTAVLFGVAGVSTLLATALYTFYEPTYYDASAFGDYLAVVGLSATLVITGIALVLLWRDPPVKRGSLFLLLAGIAAAAEGLGNLFEDAFDVEAAVWASSRAGSPCLCSWSSQGSLPSPFVPRGGGAVCSCSLPHREVGSVSVW